MEEKTRAVIIGFLGALILLAVYFSIITLISGWTFAWSQFTSFWYFILVLSLGFGIQVGLYVFLQAKIKNNAGAKRMVAVTGGASGAAMISCCSHYLVHILPIIGISGIASLLGQYQRELFWAAIGLNTAGILFIGNRVRKVVAV